MISNTPWLKTIEQFDDEAIASVAVRLAPIGRLEIGALLRLHLNMNKQSAATIASRPDAIAELAALGSFDLQKLSAGAWTNYKDRTEFLGRALPVGWFEPERRRVAPARLADDGKNARIRNIWLVSAMPCDVVTGEALLDRCPACLNLLGWTNLRSVWSCQVCEFDLRSVCPRLSLPEQFAAAKELASYIFSQQADLPAALSALECLDILKLAGWLSHFRGIPKSLFLSAGPKNAAEGFAQLRRWPASFDEIVLQLLGASKGDDLTVGDLISRNTAAGGLLTCIDGLTSAKAREVVKNRLSELLDLPNTSIEAFREVMEPEMAFNSGKDRYSWPRPSTTDSTRLSHDRASLRPAELNR